MELNLDEIRERISLCEDSLKYCKDKQASLLQHSSHLFDLEAVVIYNVHYEQPVVWRALIRCLFDALKNFLFENYALLGEKDRQERVLDEQKEQIGLLRQQIITITTQYHTELTKMREEMMLSRLLAGEEQEQTPTISKRVDENRDKREQQS